jgi:hypothetical protein
MHSASPATVPLMGFPATNNGLQSNGLQNNGLQNSTPPSTMGIGFNNSAAAISTMNQMMPNPAPLGMANTMRMSPVMGMAPNGVMGNSMGMNGGMQMGVPAMGMMNPNGVSGGMMGNSMGMAPATSMGGIGAMGMQNPAMQGGVPGGMMMNSMGTMSGGMSMSSGTGIMQAATGAMSYSQPMGSMGSGPGAMANPLRGFVNSGAGGMVGGNGSGKAWSTASPSAATAPQDAFDFVGATMKSQLGGK